MPIGIAWMEALSLAVPASDLTPEERFVTLSPDPDTYALALKVVNAAGNAATSTVAVQVGVQTAASPPATGDRFVAVGNLNAESPYDTWAKAAESIQTALNATIDDGELIRVWSGIYRAPTNAVFGSGATNVVNIVRPVTLRGVGSAETTVIDGEGLNRGMRVAYNQSEPPLVLDGFTLVNGLAPGGGAVVYANNDNESHFLNCRFIRNTAKGERSSSGGAIDAGANTMIMENCLFRENQVVSGGDGGAIKKVRGTLLVSDSRFEHNRAGHTTHQRGGAMFFEGNSPGPYTFERSVFVGNRSSFGGNAGSGGGVVQMRDQNTDLTFRNCLMVDNDGYSAGTIVRTQSDSYQGITFENCTVVGNGSRTISLRGGTGTLRIYNSIFWDNILTDVANLPSGWTPLFFNSVVTLQTPANVPDYNANENFAIDPQFVDPAAGDYRLKRGSPCIDTGIYRSWMPGATDLDGRARINAISGVVDRGAYEFHHPATILLLR